MPKSNTDSRLLIPMMIIFLGVLSSCTSVTIDEDRRSDSAMTEADSVVILGRRQASDYETEPSLIECIGDSLSSGQNRINVIPEQQFVNTLYPWFEPRTAPMQVSDLQRLAKNGHLVNAMKSNKVRYIIWVDGNTETTSSAGSIGCSIGTGGAGCFGFGTWDKESDYEVTVWDYHNREVMGKISADASGTSYMPAVVVPIPIIARVQANACKGIGSQLRDFLKPKARKKK